MQHIHTRLSIVLLCFGVASCGADDKTPDDATSMAGQGASTTALPAGAMEHVFAMDPVEVPAETEFYMCQDLPNPFGRDIAILQSESDVSVGSHHMFAFRIPASTAMLATDGSKGPLFACPGGGLEFHPYFHLTQRPHDVMTYPEGVGRLLPGTDVIRFNIHYLNASSAPITTKAEVRIAYSEPSAVEQLAGEVFVYGGSLRVPIGKSTQMFSYKMPSDVKLLQATGHMHSRGQHFRADALSAAGDLAPRMIYESVTWQDPVTKDFAPAFEMKAGDTLQYACDFENDTDAELVAGESAASNEMCNFFGVYYPANNGAALTPLL